MQDGDNIQLLLQARTVTMRFFNVMYGGQLDDSAFEAGCNESVRASLELLLDTAGELSEDMHKTLVHIWKRLEEAKSGDEQVRETLASEYLDLFVGPIKIQTPPWESAYLGDSRVLFQQLTLDVRNTYRQSGFLPMQYPKVADDHIALEFAFLAELAARAASAWESKDAGCFNNAIDSAQKFECEHLGTFLSLLRESLSQSPSADFYREVTDLAAGFISADIELSSILQSTSCSNTNTLSLA